jgi:hypothetical protein
MALFQTERGDGGYVFDGLDTGGANVNTEITGTPKYQGDDDTYNIPVAGEPTIRSPPPQLWLAMDTFWVFDTKGLHYINRDTPRGSQAAGQ